MNRWLEPPREPRRYSDTAPVQCQAEVQIGAGYLAGWRKERYGDSWRCCSFPAVCEIEGKTYCKRHGGEVALAKLLV